MFAEGSLLRRGLDFVIEPLREAEAERERHLASEAGRGFDWETSGALVLVALVLTGQEYILRAEVWRGVVQVLDGWFLGLAESWLSWENYSFGVLSFWALGQTFLYVVPACLFIRCVAKRRVREYGLKLTGAFSMWGLYLGMLAVMIPIVFVVSASEGFQRTYPFYEPRVAEALWPRFWLWEAAYYLQFVGLEFFFRGFLLHGTRRRFGAYAIFVMMVPYCMIHFGKPAAETLAAIVAGLALGFMSLKTRSVWMGAALHVSVALTMDLCALWRVGRFE